MLEHSTHIGTNGHSHKSIFSSQSRNGAERERSSPLVFGRSDSIPTVISGHIHIGHAAFPDVQQLEDLNENLTETAHYILGNRYFVGFVHATIVVNALEMGFAVGDQHADHVIIFDVFEHFFTAVFAAEMVLKLWVLRMSYFIGQGGSWNALDFGIALMSILDMWILSPLGNQNNLEVVRIFRLARVMRLAKLVRSIPEVTVVVEGMVASLRAMIWIILLLVIVIYTFGIMFVEAVGGEGKDTYPSYDAEMADQISQIVGDFNNYFYFGSIFRAMVTLFGLILLAEWGDVARPLYEMQPFMFGMVALLFVICTLGIFNVIIGVIVERTTKAMFDARELTQDQLRLTRAMLANQLADVMFEIDADGDGVVSREELRMAGDNQHLLEILRGIELPQGFTLLNLHTMLDLKGKGELSKSDFIMGFLRLIHSDAFSSVCLTQFAIGQLKSQISNFHGELTGLRESKQTHIASLQAIATEIAQLRADLLADLARKALDGPAAWSPQDSQRPTSNVSEQFEQRDGASTASRMLVEAALSLEAPLARLSEIARFARSEQLLSVLEEPALSEASPPPVTVSTKPNMSSLLPLLPDGEGKVRPIGGFPSVLGAPPHWGRRQAAGVETKEMLHVETPR